MQGKRYIRDAVKVGEDPVCWVLGLAIFPKLALSCLARPTRSYSQSQWVACPLHLTCSALTLPLCPTHQFSGTERSRNSSSVHSNSPFSLSEHRPAQQGSCLTSACSSLPHKHYSLPCASCPLPLMCPIYSEAALFPMSCLIPRQNSHMGQLWPFVGPA